MRQGRILSPSGIEFNGVEITIGGISDPGAIKRTYDDIEKILRGNKQSYKEVETKTEAGTFKSYVIET